MSFRVRAGKPNLEMKPKVLRFDMNCAKLTHLVGRERHEAVCKKNVDLVNDGDVSVEVSLENPNLSMCPPLVILEPKMNKNVLFTYSPGFLAPTKESFTFHTVPKMKDFDLELKIKNAKLGVRVASLDFGVIDIEESKQVSCIVENSGSCDLYCILAMYPSYKNSLRKKLTLFRIFF